MRYDITNINNKFIVIASIYLGYIDDYMYETNIACFDNNKFELIASLITIFQDMENKERDIVKIVDDYINTNKKQLNNYDYFEKCIETYFKHYFNIDITSINKDATSAIINEVDEFIDIPDSHSLVSLSSIQIIKDNNLLDVLDPNDDDINQSVEYITNWLKDIK